MANSVPYLFDAYGSVKVGLVYTLDLLAHE
jgi:hypothetical protein